jgi:hypothetical protein
MWHGQRGQLLTQKTATKAVAICWDLLHLIFCDAYTPQTLEIL